MDMRTTLSYSQLEDELLAANARDRILRSLSAGKPEVVAFHALVATRTSRLKTHYDSRRWLRRIGPPLLFFAGSTE